MSLVDLGKRLLEAARKGQDDEVRNLMANGAPFTTDWVRYQPYNVCFHSNNSVQLVSRRLAAQLTCFSSVTNEQQVELSL